MRVVETIPHSHFTINIFQMNDKYIIKVELGRYEQAYKINTEDVMGLEDIRKLMNDTFFESCMKRFNSMRADFTEAYNTIRNE